MTIEYENKVLLGDCLAVLRQLPDAAYDSVVVDPPYGLGKEPSVEEIVAYLQGADLVTGDFMGKDWKIPSVLVWREVFRVLKPGGHVLSFGGTRTFDLISLGLRAAGFENRDTISSMSPGLMWVQGQGMPKSTSVSKQIDKKAGAERKIVGKRTDGRYKYGFSEEAKKAQGSVTHEYSKGWVGDPTEITEPATEDAKTWDGWGSGIKPCWEPILVFRKPLSEKTISENVLKHGTGAINIDGCRVKHSSPEDFEKHKAGVEAIKARGGSMDNSWKNSSDLSGANEVTSAGRWPSNLTLTHSSECKRVGTKKVRSGVAVETNAGNTQGYHKNWGRREGAFSHAGTDGLEETSAWECAPGCPVAELDAQSGNRRSTLAGRADPTKAHTHPGIDTTTESMWFGKDRTFLGQVYADEGGASRFYPQFEGQTPVEVPFFYTGKATKKETTLDGEIENKHPTKKPLALMKWLVRLVTPKGGITIDPYCGSGSTLHAAVEEGVRFTGIDNDPVSHGIASKRMEIVQSKAQDQKGQRDLFDLLMSGDLDE